MLNAHELLAHAETLTDSVQLVDRILRAGLLLHASNVHMDPAADSVRVRFRIDGMLEEVLRIPAAMQGAVRPAGRRLHLADGRRGRVQRTAARRTHGHAAGALR